MQLKSKFFNDFDLLAILANFLTLSMLSFISGTKEFHTKAPLRAIEFLV